MSIETIQQSTAVTDVGQIVITEAVEDTENEVFTREIRVYGSTEGVSGSRPLLFTLRVSGATANDIALNAPVQTF